MYFDSGVSSGVGWFLILVLLLADSLVSCLAACAAVHSFLYLDAG
jgi:hypothetical protein